MALLIFLAIIGGAVIGVLIGRGINASVTKPPTPSNKEDPK
jgi:hypothetical protein